MKTLIKELREERGETILSLENSPFRPASGGQPCDFGTISSRLFGAVVYDVLDQETVKVKLISGKPEKGEAEALIDEKRRKKLTRMHTAEHILFKSIQNFVPESKVDKIKLSEEDGVIYILAKAMDLESVYLAEKLANQVVEENRKIHERIIKREEMHLYPELRIKEERVKGEEFRAIEIEGHDLSACSGTHCQSTSEVGVIFVAKVNSSGQERFEVRFKLDAEKDMLFCSHIARKVSFLLGTELEKVPKTLENLKEENEKLKKIARSAGLALEEESISQVRFLSAILEDYEKDPILKKMEELGKEKVIVAIINKTSLGSQLFLSVNESLPQDASAMIRMLAAKGFGKGGGKKGFASGSFTVDAVQLLKEVKSLI